MPSLFSNFDLMLTMHSARMYMAPSFEIGFFVFHWIIISLSRKQHVHSVHKFPQTRTNTYIGKITFQTIFLLTRLPMGVGNATRSAPLIYYR